MRIWKELQPRLTDVLTTSGAKLVRISFVGHSLGGLLLRRVAAELHAWNLAQGGSRIVLDSYVSIATPHLGTRCLCVDGEGGVGPLVRATSGLLRGACA